MRKFTLVLPGADVRNPTLSDIIVSEKYPNPKVLTTANPEHAGDIFVNWQSSIALPDGAIQLIDLFPHGYDYVPTVIGTYKFDNGFGKIEGTLPFQYGALGIIVLDADATNINLKYYSLDLSGAVTIPPFTMTVRYYVMAERGVVSSN